jgi:putative glutamine amidotransferase
LRKKSYIDKRGRIESETCQKGERMAVTIGISCGWEEKNNWHKLHDEYVCAVQAAGGIPFLLPGLDSVEAITVYYNQLDGFIFSGGSDVDPFYFGEEPLRGLGEITARRDCFELMLARLCLAGDKPVLGICRGLQLLNIAAGGDVYQDIRQVTGLEHNQRAARWYATHSVQVAPESWLYQLTLQESFRVNSFHHQAVRRVGKGLRAVAWSQDGLIEALESEPEEGADGKPARIVAVQWHPECNWSREERSLALFKNLIAGVLTQKGS